MCVCVCVRVRACVCKMKKIVLTETKLFYFDRVFENGKTGIGFNPLWIRHWPPVRSA